MANPRGAILPPLDLMLIWKLGPDRVKSTFCVQCVLVNIRISRLSIKKNMDTLKVLQVSMDDFHVYFEG